MRAPRTGEENRSSSTSPLMRGGATMPALSPAQLGSLADQAHKAMRGSGPFGSGVGVDKSALFAALSQLGAKDGLAFAAVYQQRHGASVQQHIGQEHFLDKAERARANAYVSGNPIAAHAIEMREALAKGDIASVRALFKGATAESNAALADAYRAQMGRDLEYDMRGFADTAPKNVAAPTISLGVGLRGQELVEGLALLHGPRMQQTAERIAALSSQAQPLNERGRTELYAILQREGGETRTLLAEKFRALTGNDLNAALSPMLADAVKANDEKPITSPPEKTVAVVVSSGNWQQMLDGKSDKHIGGYHWRIAGGHGSHHDLVGHKEVERAGLSLNEAGKPVSAVCHATPALGALLKGHNATGFSPQFDAVMSRAGYVLPEFIPPYDAHAGLRSIGAKVSTVEAFNIHHTERFDKNGAAVMTGTGPEATDNVAKQMFAYLAEPHSD